MRHIIIKKPLLVDLLTTERKMSSPYTSPVSSAEHQSSAATVCRFSPPDREKNELAMYLSSKFHRAVKFCNCLRVFTCSKIFHFHDFSAMRLQSNELFLIHLSSLYSCYTLLTNKNALTAALRSRLLGD